MLTSWLAVSLVKASKPDDMYDDLDVSPFVVGRLKRCHNKFVWTCCPRSYKTGNWQPKNSPFRFYNGVREAPIIIKP